MQSASEIGGQNLVFDSHDYLFSFLSFHLWGG